MSRRAGCIVGLISVLGAAGCSALAAAGPTPTPEPTTFVIITATPGPTNTPAPTPDLAGLIDGSLAAVEVGDAEAAQEALEEVLAVGATEQARVAWVDAVSGLYNQGDYQQAADLAAAGLAHFPDDTGLLFMGGVAALTLDDTEAAIDLLGRVVELNPQDYRAWHLHGVAQMRAGDAEQAIPDLEQAVALGEAAGVMGRSSAFEAMADLGVALAVGDPQAGLVYINEKRGYYFNYEGVLSGALLAGQGRIWGQSDLTTDGALDVLNRSIQRNYVEGYYYRAEVWSRIGENEKAIRDLETYLELRPVGVVSQWARDLLAELQAT